MLVADRDERAPDAPAQQVPSEHEHQRRHRKGEEVEPLVGIHPQTGLAQERGRLGLGDYDALHAAGPFLEVVVLEELRHGNAEREGGEREVKALQAQRRQPKEESGHQAHRARRGKGRPVGRAEPVHQDGGGIRADRVEGAVPERDLAVVAGEDVEPEKRDRVDQHERELERAVVADHERQHARDRDEHHNADGRASRHTRLTFTLPKSPEGLTSSTPMMSPNATESLRSLPIT